MLKSEDFKQKIAKIYPKNYLGILDTHYISKDKSFRINFLKANNNIISKLKDKGFTITESAISNSYIVEESSNLSSTDEYLKGEIYIQELSSMLPVLILNPQENEKILDLCAAPGSKTSQITAIVNNNAEITAVEENKNRFFKLKEILKLQGVRSCNVLLADGVMLPFRRPDFINYFDKILVDAPCTGEANLNLSDENALKFWRSSNASRLAKLQKGLLNSALKMLKKGGTIVYSTCTYSVEENEIVLDWILKKHPNLVIQKSDINIPNIVSGITEWNGRKLSPQIVNAIRIIPDKNFNAFFIAKIIKQ